MDFIGPLVFVFSPAPPPPTPTHPKPCGRQGRASLIMIWVIITEVRKTERERSGDRMHARRMSREVVGGERVCFVFNVIVFAFHIYNYFPVPVMLLCLTVLLLSHIPQPHPQVWQQTYTFTANDRQSFCFSCFFSRSLKALRKLSKSSLGIHPCLYHSPLRFQLLHFPFSLPPPNTVRYESVFSSPHLTAIPPIHSRIYGGYLALSWSTRGSTPSCDIPLHHQCVWALGLFSLHRRLSLLMFCWGLSVSHRN